MATINDVARAAGVAPSTVSYALSGKRPVSAEVRARIEQAMEALEFSPNHVGRLLREGRSGTIGLLDPLVAAESDWSTAGFIPSTASSANQAGYMLSLVTEPQTPQQVIELFRQGKVDGVILAETAWHDARGAALRTGRHPFVMIGRCEQSDGINLVDFDFEQAIFTAFEHLANLGHTVIGHIAPAEQDSATSRSYTHFLKRGYERACRELGVTIAREPAGGTIADGFRATEALLRQHPAMTAIVPIFKSTPIGALWALRIHQRHVPDDCSMVCIANPSAAEWSSPRLTSVDVPLAEMGRVGVALLLKRIVEDAAPEQVIMPARLVVRESTAPRPRR
jgi:DNA-binding LacI/PurR family transcriptional regulator